LPFGMPGIGLEMDGAMQHAAHSGRQERCLLMPPFYLTQVSEVRHMS
jgi:hypothetical protein